MKNEWFTSRQFPRRKNTAKFKKMFTAINVTNSSRQMSVSSVLHRSEFAGKIYISFRAFNFYSKLYFILCFSLPVKTGLLVTETSQCASNSQLLHTGFHIAEFKNSSSSQLCHLWFFSNTSLITFRLINAVYWPLSVCPEAICYAIWVQSVLLLIWFPTWHHDGCWEKGLSLWCFPAGFESLLQTLGCSPVWI